MPRFWLGEPRSTLWSSSNGARSRGLRFGRAPRVAVVESDASSKDGGASPIDSGFGARLSLALVDGAFDVLAAEDLFRGMTVRCVRPSASGWM